MNEKLEQSFEEFFDEEGKLVEEPDVIYKRIGNEVMIGYVKDEAIIYVMGHEVLQEFLPDEVDSLIAQLLKAKECLVKFLEDE